MTMESTKIVKKFQSAEVPFDASQPLELQMKASQGTARALVKDGPFGADVIRFAAGEGVNTHRHAGAHILYVLSGTGVVEYGHETHDLNPGTIYLIPSAQPHAIRARDNLMLLAVGDDHQPADSTFRLVPMPDRQTGAVTPY